MNILITGAAGNLGSFLAQHLLHNRHNLRLLIHRKPLPFDVSPFRNVTVYPADLEKQETLHEPCLDAHLSSTLLEYYLHQGRNCFKQYPALDIIKIAFHKCLEHCL